MMTDAFALHARDVSMRQEFAPKSAFLRHVWAWALPLAIVFGAVVWFWPSAPRWVFGPLAVGAALQVAAAVASVYRGLTFPEPTSNDA